MCSLTGGQHQANDNRNNDTCHDQDTPHHEYTPTNDERLTNRSSHTEPPCHPSITDQPPVKTTAT
jgi:hypothetical protein